MGYPNKIPQLVDPKETSSRLRQLIPEFNNWIGKVTVALAGALKGTRSRINFIAGSNVTIAVTDDPTTDELDVTISSSGGGGGLSDGNYGDVTVSGGGTAIAINADAVTYAKMQNVSAGDMVLGRVTGAGNVEEIPMTAAGRALVDDANTAAQRTTLGLGALATLGTVGTAQIDDDAVTYAKMQNVSAASRLLGRGSASGAGDPEEITPGTGLSIAGTVLNAAVPTTGTTTVNFSTGLTDCTVAITGQTGIVAGSRVNVWIECTATADHSVDEHSVVDIDVRAGNIVAGTGFTIYARTRSGLQYGQFTVGWSWV